ncbi:DHH family phosphoesterase [Clostridium ljungdahlii]|uniref:Bifunctional oligoribonuclease and PAP phosphatase NrnA n=1 Tax=Clostridium ljungdahlii TaxID=1538 RepID=A0A168L7R8_9CLOT|nr:bifunctional oligoribonuclease/PAP phosphatase NrnA [Clostridium ljungdahlii]OAA82781.1 Bifunctional oligoribonuclease and PAP phosphatase NrnA [Clostridium ljungdahlii]
MIMNDIISEIRRSNKIAITFHSSPDGDSIGSSLALFQGMRKLGKEVEILSKEKIPESFSFLPCSENINGKKFEVDPEVECVIVLDCGDVKRINADLKFEQGNYTVINIDHHLTNELYGNLNYVDTNAAAVSEIVYQLLKLMDVELDKNIAQCLYTSIITDSGSFRYPSTTCVTHTIAGDLINTGMDFSEIHRIIFENKKFNRIKLYGKAIESMELIKDSICVISITKAMLSEVGIEGDIDTSDIVNIGMKVNTVEVGILLKEVEGKIKVSLRSKSKVDVRKIAEKFNGGGHVRASGLAVSDKSIDEVKDMILKEVEKELI